MKTLTVDSVYIFNQLHGLNTPHPLISVVDLRKSTRVVNHLLVKYGLYALFLKNVPYCSVKYGRRSYDFQEGTVVSFAPGQTVEVNLAAEEVSQDVIGLIFHPDLIYGTPLADKIRDFGFFNYSELEALHLSEEERDKFTFFIKLIEEELNRPIDSHSSSVLAANIQLLLEHLDRFYDRQFITRHKVNSDVVSQFEQNLKAYYAGNDAVTQPTVGYFADKACLSVGYFSDLIKKETGSNPKDLISQYVIGEAKKRLAQSNDGISEIAYKLGFDYPAHFTRMFKRIAGISPREYRNRLN